MKLMALDIAALTGVAIGVAGDDKPRIWTERFVKRGENFTHGCERLANFMRDWLRVESPDAIIVEDFLHPLAQLSADVVIQQLHFHGVVRALAACKSVPIRTVRADVVRVHFCGKKSALKITRGEKTPKQKADARKATKQMVLQRAILLGYLPRGASDDNAADAAAIFDWACHHVARTTPRELHLFEEPPRNERRRF